MNIGLIGVGAIGKFLLEKINYEKIIPGYQITSIFDDRENSQDVLAALVKEFNFTVYNDLDAYLKSSIDLVVECANISVVRKYVSQIIHEKDLFLISVGALANSALYETLQLITKLRDRKIYLPSGAIGGLDVLRATNVLGGLDSVRLVTRKPGQAFSILIRAEDTL